MKIFLTLLLLAASTTVLAENWKLDLEVHGVSKHFDTRTKYNERNLGYGYALTKSGLGLTVGRYHNSRYKMSNYLAFTQSTEIVSGVEVGYELGVVSGYGPGLSPLVVPKISLQLYKQIGLNIRIMPAIQDITPAVASASLIIRLN